MKNFDGFGLCDALNKSLAHMKYTTPTPIQAQAIPLALAGHDIMGSAQTGTGKTAAFAIPLVERLLTNPRGSALVLTPTRELGKQIMDIMHQLLGPKSPIKTAFIIGGEPMGKQFNQLRARPRLIVGTPGRINDHLERGSLMLNDADFLVLDETDRMLDMGFTVQLERIFKYMPEERQTLMFSATLPKNILKMSENYLNNPKRVSVGETNVVAAKIKQEVIRIEQDKKYEELCAQLHQRQGSVIVFIKTKYAADKMADRLRREGFTSEALHGDLRQNKRDKVMVNFRKQNFRVLIATDIAARGLDVPHIEHVVNYDLPQVAEDFIHRMGRTARAGAEGSAVSFVSSQEWRKWHAIERLLNPEAANDRGSSDRDRPRRSNGGPKGSGKPFNKRRPSRENEERRPRHSENGNRPEFEGQKRRPRKEGENHHTAKRDEGRSEKRRSEFSGEKRRDNRSDNRPENRGENRGEKRKFDNRKPDFKGDGRKSEFKGDARKSEKSGEKRSSNNEGFKKRPPQNEASKKRFYGGKKKAA